MLERQTLLANSNDNFFDKTNPDFVESLDEENSCPSPSSRSGPEYVEGDVGRKMLFLV